MNLEKERQKNMDPDYYVDVEVNVETGSLISGKHYYLK
jgi:hypothetical protein